MSGSKKCAIYQGLFAAHERLVEIQCGREVERLLVEIGDPAVTNACDAYLREEPRGLVAAHTRLTEILRDRGVSDDARSS
jgi:hypothetical protein